MELKPLSNKIILEAANAEEKTKSGIIIPETVSQEKPEQGKVIAAGPGKLSDSGELCKMTVKVGDTVIFSKYSPSEIKLDGKEYLVVSEDDVLAIVS